jgi:hypothetical protein
VDPFAKQSQPFDGLVAEDESDVPVGDLVAPASHGRGSHLLLEQAIRYVHAVKAEGGDIQQKRPSSCRPHDGESLELPERLVATPPPFGIRHGQIVVAHAKRDASSNLVEPTRHEAVVDVNSRDIVDKITRRYDPADAPGTLSIGCQQPLWELQLA